MSPPAYVMTFGFTPVPLAEGEVSTCAINPIAGTLPNAGCPFGRFDGTDAMTYPYLSIVAFRTPISFSSLKRRLSKSNCLRVLGYSSLSSLDWVSILT